MILIIISQNGCPGQDFGDDQKGLIRRATWYSDAFTGNHGEGMNEVYVSNAPPRTKKAQR